MICIRDFLVFLSEYKCLGAYWANFEGSNFADDYRTAEFAISSVFERSPRNWLLASFNWDHSAEGSDYWLRLHDLWDMRCNNLIKQNK